LITKTLINDIISKKFLIEENNLVIDLSFLPIKTYSIYSNFLKCSSDFNNFFSVDAHLLFENSLKAILMTKSCASETCNNVNFDLKSLVKVCYICYNIYHAGCKNSNPTNKKFKCLTCKND